MWGERKKSIYQFFLLPLILLPPLLVLVLILPVLVFRLPSLSLTSRHSRVAIEHEEPLRLGALRVLVVVETPTS